MKLRGLHLTTVLVALSALAIAPREICHPASARTPALPQTPATRQKPTSVTTRQPTGVQTQAQRPPQTVPGRPPDIELEAPTKVMVGETVTLTVRLVIPALFSRAGIDIPKVEYRFAFGEGAPTVWTNSATATHIYEAPNEYRAAAQIRLVEGGSDAKPGPPKIAIITVVPNPAIIRAASPAPSPSASASPSPSASPGDSPSPSPSPSESPSASPSANPFDSPPPTQGHTANEEPLALPRPSPGRVKHDEAWGRTPWLILLIAVLLVAVIGYRIVKWAYTPKAIFDAYPDYGNAKIVADRSEPLAIKFELLLKANIDEGDYQFTTDEPSLVTYLRRENG